MPPKTNYLEQILGKNAEARAAIREIPAFRNCSASLLELVFRYGRITALRAGDVMIRENEFDQWVFFILNGRLAVYVGEDQVDTISSSLVGERCILGEPRRATLRAAESGTTALSIDMAILDSLRQSGEDSSQDTAVMVELLGIITGEIVRRVTDFAYTYYDISEKYQAYLRLENRTEILAALRENAFQEEPRANIEIYKVLRRSNKALLNICLTGSQLKIDTAKLVSLCMNSGLQAYIYDLTGTLASVLDGVRDAPQSSPAQADTYSFPDFSARALNALNALDDTRGSGPSSAGKSSIPESSWKRQFEAVTEPAAMLGRVCRWMKSSHGYTDLELIDALTTILKEASEYTALINGSIKSMVREIGQIKFINQVEMQGAAQEITIADVLDYRSPESLIPIFSKQILNVHLIGPYLEELGLPLPEPEEASGEETAAAQPPPPEPEEDPAQNLADSLFD